MEMPGPFLEFSKRGGTAEQGEVCRMSLFNATSVCNHLCLLKFLSSTLIWLHLASSLWAPACSLMLQHMLVSSCCISPRADHAGLKEKNISYLCTLYSQNITAVSPLGCSRKRCWINRSSHGIAVPFSKPRSTGKSAEI